MKIIDMQGGSSAPQFVRAFVGGAVSAGKTFFAATAPRPLFLSDFAEGGYNTIRSMPRQLFWDPGYVPEVWALEKIADVGPTLTKLEEHVAKGTFPWKTVVFDPISLYSERAVSELQEQNRYKDPRQLYGDLAFHLRRLLLRMHALPANIIWLSHLQTTDNEVSAAISGKMGATFPAWCDFKWLCYANTQQPKGAPAAYELHTQPFLQYRMLGSRIPMPPVVIPSFKCVAQIIGLADKPISPAVPGFDQGCVYPGFPTAGGATSQ